MPVPKFKQITTGTRGDAENIDYTLYGLDEEGRTWVYAESIPVKGTLLHAAGWTLFRDETLEEAEERIRKKAEGANAKAGVDRSRNDGT